MADAAGLVVPVECAGCGRWDVALCPDCRALLQARPERCEDDAPMLAGEWTGRPLPTWSLGPYRGPLRAIVLAWKTHRRQDIAPAVLAGAAEAARTWAGDADLRREIVGARQVLVVPAPSGWRRRVARRLVVADLADAVGRGMARGLREAAEPGPGRVLVVDVLRRRRGGAHQAGLGARGRAANRAGTVVALAAPPAGAVVVLVDDVLTTGATLAASRAAVEQRGGRVAGALVLASTPAPGRAARATRRS
ncbi:ComF family protein [Georgenia ruanii]|uniref:ComF family protein n=1 Tax=Georgenia ruanii TaxID=348442 RepID=A0A7J9USX5_9MICO|nr:ComF family protein [Georgenia ruanii]